MLAMINIDDLEVIKEDLPDGWDLLGVVSTSRINISTQHPLTPIIQQLGRSLAWINTRFSSPQTTGPRRSYLLPNIVGP